MIHLDVEKCCERCPNFVATSDTAEIFADGEENFNLGSISNSITFIFIIIPS